MPMLLSPTLSLLSLSLSLLSLHIPQATATSLFPTAICPAIQDPLTNPPPTTCPVLQDGATTNAFPWTYPPICVSAVLPSPEGTGLGTHEHFCVYTNTVFHNGRGISLVTTPETAAGLTVDQFSTYGFDGEVGAERGGKEKRKEVSEVRGSKGKGLGLFAKGSGVEAGETVVLEAPVLIVAKEALASPSRQRRQLLLGRAVERLPVGTREAVMALARSRAGEDEVGDLVRTNSAGVKVWDGVPHLAVVPEAARINHACRPNAYFRFDDFALTWDVFAIKNILPGEEITLSYGFSTHTSTSRLQALQQIFNFKCTCSLCTSNTTNLSASDNRLTQISDIKDVLPTKPDDIPQLIGLLPNLISLLEEEDLHTEIPMYEEILAYTWSAFGIEDRARYWAGRARTHWEIVAGKGSWEAKRTGILESNVKAHGTWMSWEGDPWEGEGKGHPWGDGGEGHEHDHDHDH